MTTIEWRRPAPIWTVSTVGGEQRPALVQCNGDSFLPDFLDLMEGRTPGQTPKALADQLLPPVVTPQKLFLPAHGQYYLVTGSLVCRQLSLPDRTVSRASGDSTSFVIRRLAHDASGQPVYDAYGQQVEQAWVNAGPQKGWHVIGSPKALYDGEERLPLHHVDACAAYQPGESIFADAFGLSDCGRRAVYYGYIPVASRDKYADRYPLPDTGDPTANFQAFVDQVLKDEPGHDPRKDDFDDRVYKPWLGLYANPITESGAPDTPPAVPETRNVFSLYLLLDLLDVIQSSLPTVYAALDTSDGGSLAGSRKALYNRLHSITITSGNAGTALTAALNELKPRLSLVQDPSNSAAVSDTDYATLSGRYNLPNGDPGLADLKLKFEQALAEEKQARDAAGQPWVPTPSAERLSLLRDQVAPAPPGDDVYVLRLVYEHAPCCPVLSDASQPVTFAKFYDPDAPARHIRIELPSIKPRDLRKYKRGVGLEMSPELRKLMNRVHKGLLKGENLADGGGDFTLGMICSFSLQIIFLVAFIVMFIFLILLNFIFWWMPFLKICFPIPKKR
jgi:hypothetical protein